MYKLTLTEILEPVTYLAIAAGLLAYCIAQTLAVL